MTSWSPLELTPVELCGIEQYLNMGTHTLLARDKAQIQQIETTIRHANDETNKPEYLGWLAFELADIEDRYQRPQAIDHLIEASDHTLHAFKKNQHPSAITKQLTLSRNVALFNLRRKAVESRIYGEDVDAQVTRDYIGSLAVIGCDHITNTTWNDHNKKKRQRLIGATTELLFSTLFIDTLVESDGGPRLLPQPSTPRREQPKIGVKCDIPGMNRASDLILRQYPIGWHAGREYAVQTKTHYSDEIDDEYDKSAVTMLYACAQLGVDNHIEGRRLAQAIIAKERTSDQADLVKNAHANVLLELGF